MLCEKDDQENYIFKIATVIPLLQVFTKNKRFSPGISFYNSRDSIKLYVYKFLALCDYSCIENYSCIQNYSKSIVLVI